MNRCSLVCKPHEMCKLSKSTRDKCPYCKDFDTCTYYDKLNAEMALYSTGSSYLCTNYGRICDTLPTDGGLR